MGIFGPIGDLINKPVKKVLDALTGGDAARESAAAMKEQIKAYREQTALTKAELDRKRGEAAIEKRRVEEKQIRALRNNYRSKSMLGASAPAAPDMNTNLGG